jgi:5,10-methylenetetrahydromethanopterin reductase
VAGLEDAIVTLGRLTAGERLERGGRPWRVHRSGRRVPVYLAAEGPRTLELAGRVADGVICGLGLTPPVIALSLEAIERGARAAGRRLDDVDVWWFAKTSLADTRAAAIEPIKMARAASANHAFRFTLEGKGVAPDLHEKIRALQREYNAHQHEIAGAANASLPDRWDLTDFLADRFAVAGTPADCVAQLRRAMSAGARQFMITGFVPDPRGFMRRWMKEVAAAL